VRKQRVAGAFPAVHDGAHRPECTHAGGAHLGGRRAEGVGDGAVDAVDTTAEAPPPSSDRPTGVAQPESAPYAASTRAPRSILCAPGVARHGLAAGFGSVPVRGPAEGIGAAWMDGTGVDPR